MIINRRTIVTILSITALISLSLSLLALPAQVLAADSAACRASYDPAQNFGNVLKRVACIAGFIEATTPDSYDRQAIALIIGEFVNIALSFAGIIFMIILLYGGWLWGTARGNEEQVSKAESLIRNAVIGIIITFTAFAISNFILRAIGSGLQGGWI